MLIMFLELVGTFGAQYFEITYLHIILWKLQHNFWLASYNIFKRILLLCSNYNFIITASKRSSAPSAR